MKQVHVFSFCLFAHLKKYLSLLSPKFNPLIKQKQTEYMSALIDACKAVNVKKVCYLNTFIYKIKVIQQYQVYFHLPIALTVRLY